MECKLGPIIDGQPIYDFREHADPPDLPTPQPPTPAQEYERARFVRKLRDWFHIAVQHEFQTSPPRETFNRWLIAQAAATPTTNDPILRHPELTDVIRDQLFEALPASAYVNWSARRRPRLVRQIAKNWIRHLNTWLEKAPDSEHKTKAQTAIKNPLPNTVEEFNAIRRECRGFIRAICSGRVDNLLKQLVARARVGIHPNVHAARVRLVDNGGDFLHLCYLDDVQRVSRLHMEKLRTLYYLHNTNPDNFLDALYTVLRRYDTFFGEVITPKNGKTLRDGSHSSRLYVPPRENPHVPPREGTTMHAAAPPKLFAYLRDHLGVTQEGFASPFNCYFRHYCSAFQDTDAPFGSLGSFFDFCPTRGSYEVGPPYTVEVMERTVRHCVSLLEATDRPLSFVVFGPDWRHPLQPAQALMEKSRFLQVQIHVDGGDHAYVVGDQHLREDRHFVLPFDTEIYILQNEAGAHRWPVGEHTRLAVIEHLRP